MVPCSSGVAGVGRAPELSSHTMLVNVVSVIMRESPTPSEGVEMGDGGGDGGVKGNTGG